MAQGEQEREVGRGKDEPGQSMTDFLLAGPGDGERAGEKGVRLVEVEVADGGMHWLWRGRAGTYSVLVRVERGGR